jgi:putative membrane protein
MMWWYGNGTGGWGLALMMIGNALFWAVVVLGAVALIRHLSSPGRATRSRPTPERLLAERFARGEIDEKEYRSRLDTLAREHRTGAET